MRYVQEHSATRFHNQIVSLRALNTSIGDPWGSEKEEEAGELAPWAAKLFQEANVKRNSFPKDQELDIRDVSYQDVCNKDTPVTPECSRQANPWEEYRLKGPVQEGSREVWSNDPAHSEPGAGGGSLDNNLLDSPGKNTSPFLNTEPDPYPTKTSRSVQIRILQNPAPPKFRSSQIRILPNPDPPKSGSS